MFLRMRVGRLQFLSHCPFPVHQSGDVDGTALKTELGIVFRTDDNRLILKFQGAAEITFGSRGCRCQFCSLDPGSPMEVKYFGIHIDGTSFRIFTGRAYYNCLTFNGDGRSKCSVGICIRPRDFLFQRPVTSDAFIDIHRSGDDIFRTGFCAGCTNHGKIAIHSNRGTEEMIYVGSRRN